MVQRFENKVTKRIFLPHSDVIGLANVTKTPLECPTESILITKHGGGGGGGEEASNHCVLHLRTPP